MARNINHVRLSVDWNTVRSKKGIQTKLRVGLFTCKTFHIRTIQVPQIRDIIKNDT